MFQIMIGVKLREKIRFIYRYIFISATIISQVKLRGNMKTINFKITKPFLSIFSALSLRTLK